MSDKKLISVIIRNRNEAEFLGFALESVVRQQLVQTEVIFVDNESEDNSLEIAGEYNCKIINLPKNSFTYGKALNVGIEAAKGEICVLLSAHSMLASPFALYSCVSVFEDEEVAAARFIHSGKRFDAKRWLAPEILSGDLDIDTVVSKAPLANGCAIRKSVWEKIPFDEEVIAAEDKIWSLEVLQNGWKIFSPCPTVYFYLKDTPHKKQIEKNNRELRAIYERTGVRLGHFRETGAGKLKKFAFEIIFAPVFSLYKTLVRMFLEFSMRFTNK